MEKEKEYLVTLTISVLAESKYQAKIKVLKDIPEAYNLHAIVG